MFSPYFVEIAEVEEVYEICRVKIRIPPVHGEKGGSNSVPTENLPYAYPVVPLVYNKDELDALVEIGDRLYVTQMSPNHYVYFGKEYVPSSELKPPEIWQDYEQYSHKDDYFGGHDLKVSNGVYEFIIGKKGLGTYCSISMDAKTGKMTLIACAGGNKGTLELEPGHAALQSILGGIASKVDLTGKAMIGSNSQLDLEAPEIYEKRGSVGGNNPSWTGRKMEPGEDKPFHKVGRPLDAKRKSEEQKL
jgi:hypothetical protein